MSFTSFLYAYLLGGLTFVPGVILIVVYYVYTYGSTPIGDPDPLKRLKNLLAETQGSDPLKDPEIDLLTPASTLKDTSATTTATDTNNPSTEPGGNEPGLRNRNRSSSIKPAGTVFPSPKLTEKHLTGWLTVRRSFNPSNTNSSSRGRRGSGVFSGTSTPNTGGKQGLGTGQGQGGADTVIGNFKQGLLETRSEKAAGQHESVQGQRHTGNGSGNGDSAGNPGVTAKYSTMLLNSYRSIVDGAKSSDTASSGSSQTGQRTVLGPSGTTTSMQPRQPAIKEFVFCALKGNVLFMYEDASMENCLGVIGIEGYSVSISRGDSEDEGDDGNNDDELEIGDEISSEDSDAMTAGEQEMLDQSGMSSEEKHRVRSKATRRKRKREARGGSEFMDGELFAKRNAVVLRAVPAQSRMRRTKSSVTTVPESGIRSGPATDRQIGTTPGMNVASDMAAKPRKSATVSVPVEHPALQRKSSLPGGSSDMAVLPGAGTVAHPGLGRGAGPPIMALTKEMDVGVPGDDLPGQPGVPMPKTILQDDPHERESRRTEKRRREEKRLDIEARPWYIFARNNVKQEQWYHALLLRSHPSPPSNSKIHVPRPTFDRIFSSNDMQKLIDTLNEDSDSIPVRWLNAMLGRIFLGICGTAALEAFIISKIMKKVRKVKTPSFLGDIVVKEIDVGRTPPYFSKPMLKELTAEGEAAFEVALHYTGDVRITIATTAIIPTAFGFKPYSINLELVVVVQAVHGNICVRIKKPPSNRIWWGFTKPPKIDLRVLPVVSDRKIQVNMVLKAIEKQIRDAVNESIVLPNMDDLAFFDTRHLRARGGIFDEAAKNNDAEVKADLGPDGLEPIPVSKPRETGDESNITRQSSIQSRQPPSLAVQALDLPQGKATRLAQAEDDAQSIGGASQHSITKSISESTKKWLAAKTGANDTNTEVDRQSSEPATPVTLNTPDKSAIEKTRVGFEIRSAGHSTAAQAMDTSVETTASEGKVMDRAQDDDVRLDKLPPSLNATQQGFVPRGTLASSNADADIAAGGSAATAAALMNNIRARTADKKALQSSVNEARDAMRKWGKNWAAKRTIGVAGQPAQNAEISQKLQAVEQQIRKTKDGASSGKSTDTSPRQGTSLQERLAIAAVQAASPSSTSTSLPRQSLDAQSTGNGPVKLASSSEDRRRDSLNEGRPVLPVRQQPVGTAAMTVPRIPKRPDAVTAVSSTAHKPDTAEVSSVTNPPIHLGTSPKAPAAMATASNPTSTMLPSSSTNSLSQLVSPSRAITEVSHPSSRPETPERSSRPPSLPARSRAPSIKAFDLPEEASTVVHHQTQADGPLTPSRSAQATLKGLVAADERSRASSKPSTPITERHPPI